ncbi:MAG TPA: CoA pyrophosphatase [Steroidobacteraceae bacterium]|nr:CoA pyrophosphatase [Steroidobacteraceae bacterium]
MSNGLKQLIAERLKNTVPLTDVTRARLGGITIESAHLAERLPAERARPAAVLVPLVDRPDGLTVLLTQRAVHLKNHAGQVSFPGGRLEEKDESPLAAALRETEEEIGLSREFVHVIGYLESHLIFTGFHVVPVVAFVRPGFTLQPDPKEVAEVFEVPLVQVLDAANHSTRTRDVAGGVLHIYNIEVGERVIWGATAGMIMSLYRLLGSDKRIADSG